MFGIKSRLKRKYKRLLWALNKKNWYSLFPIRESCAKVKSDDIELSEIQKSLEKNLEYGLIVYIGDIKQFNSDVSESYAQIVLERTLDLKDDRSAFENALQDIFGIYVDVTEKINQTDVFYKNNYKLGVVITKRIRDCRVISVENDLKQYICRDHEDVLRVSKIIFSKNNIRNLRLRKNVNIRKDFLIKIDEFKKTCRENGIPLESTCIVGSAPLELFGIRKSDDIDFVVDDENRKKFGNKNTHFPNNIDIAYKNYVRNETTTFISDEELIYNDEHHFVFMGCKFANLEYIFYRKMNESRTKDIKDSYLLWMFFSYLMNYTDKPVLSEIVLKAMHL